MLKRMICAVMTALILLACTACQSENEVSTADAESVISSYYERHSVRCWQDAAAVFLSGTDKDRLIVKYPECGGSLKENAECLLMHTLCGEECRTDHKSECKNTVEAEYGKCTLEELALCTFALEMSGEKYDHSAPAEYLQKLQLRSGGYPRADEYVGTDNLSTAYALELTLLWRDKISDDSFDNLLIYISEQLSDSNLFPDGKEESATVSAATLRALIHAGVPQNGDISTAMQISFEVLLKVSLGDSLLGYKEYKNDSSYSTQATSEIIYALAVTRFGDMFSARDKR